MTQPLSQTQMSPSAAPPNRRRHSERRSFIACADVVDLNSNVSLSARTSDLDHGGCYVDTLNPLALGATVSLQLRKEGRSFSARAKVVYALPGNGMGLAFTAAEEDQSRTLQEWVGGHRTPHLPVSHASPAASLEAPSRLPQNLVIDREKLNALTQVIIMLVQKKVFSEAEAKALLKRVRL